MDAGGRHILKPVILEQLLGKRSPLVVKSEHALEQVLSILRYGLPQVSLHGVLADLDFLHDLLVIIAVKGWSSAQKNVHDYAEGPHVAPLIVLLGHYLWSQVVGCALEALQETLLFVVLACSPEVYYFQNVVLLLVDQHVLRLQITVNDALTVAVGDSL